MPARNGASGSPALSMTAAKEPATGSPTDVFIRQVGKAEIEGQATDLIDAGGTARSRLPARAAAKCFARSLCAPIDVAASLHTRIRGDHQTHQTLTAVVLSGNRRDGRHSPASHGVASAATIEPTARRLPAGCRGRRRIHELSIHSSMAVTPSAWRGTSTLSKVSTHLESCPVLKLRSIWE